jgi:predicted phage terminase large subunit-like protein
MDLGSGVRRLQRLERFLDRNPPGSVVDPRPAPRARTLRETYRECYPAYLPPDHLAPAIEVMERAAREPVKAVITLPRRAGKTELILASVAHRLRQDPSTRISYGTFGQRSSNNRSDRARKLAGRLGVPVDTASKSKQNWRTGADQGGLWATSVGGPIVGEGSDLLLLDDLFKGRAEAESSVVRDKTYNWVVADAMGTMSPTASVVLTSTRWHEDDVSGRLIAEGWEHVHVPAILPDGRSYWPSFWPLQLLEEKRELLGGEDGYDWTSLYMGRPRPSGMAIFRDRAVWDSQPLREHMRVWIGVDPAYSGKKSADYSAAVVLGEFAGRCYILDCVRQKCAQDEFAQLVKGLCDTWRPDGVVGYLNRTEQNYRSLMREHGILNFSIEFAVTDKVSHARPASYWWNSRRILTPPKASWLDDLLSEVCGFPGRHDDQVDCLAAAFLKLVGTALDWSSVNQAPLTPTFRWDSDPNDPDRFDWSISDP